MIPRKIGRRQFIEGAAALTGGAILGPAVLRAAEQAATAIRAAKASATDQVTLGRSGLKLSRLGIGTGSNGGSVQRKLGQEEFTRLLRHAYDQGITYFDTADSYKMHGWVGQAIKGLPREKLYIQSKLWGNPEKPMAEIERFRKELGVDYIDTVLLHAAVKKDWDEDRKRAIEALREAKEKKLIRAIGFSSHGRNALARAAELDWLDVALIRINPQGVAIDTADDKGAVYGSTAADVPAVAEAVKKLRDKRIGVIGMKLIGNGDFTKPEDREKSIRYVMQSGLVDAAVIGFKSTAEVDEAIQRINAALAGKPPAVG